MKAINEMTLSECLAFLKNNGENSPDGICYTDALGLQGVINRIHELTRWNNIDDSHPPKGALYEVCGVESGQYWRYYTKP